MSCFVLDIIDCANDFVSINFSYIPTRFNELAHHLAGLLAELVIKVPVPITPNLTFLERAHRPKSLYPGTTSFAHLLDE